jgi:hypothetical protein
MEITPEDLTINEFLINMIYQNKSSLFYQQVSYCCSTYGKRVLNVVSVLKAEKK